MQGPRKTPLALTNRRLLMSMKPGQAYSAYALARKFRLSAQEIQPMLDALVRRKKLEQCRANSKTVGFRLHAQNGMTSEVSSATTGESTPPRAGVFAGILTGYDSEFDRRAALCMLVRRA
jgi:hypothetical protein